jgi:hypothetical protein
MAFVYAVAFWVAFRQNKALLGMTATPARNVLNEAQQRGTLSERRRGEINKPGRYELSLQEQAYLRGVVSIPNSFLHREAIDSNKLSAHLREVLWDTASLGSTTPVVALAGQR